MNLFRIISLDFCFCFDRVSTCKLRSSRKRAIHMASTTTTMDRKVIVMMIGFVFMACSCSHVESFQALHRSSSSLRLPTRNALELLPRHQNNGPAVTIVSEIKKKSHFHPLIHLAAKSEKSNGDDDSSEENEKAPSPKIDGVVKETALLLRRLSWGSWWAQLILTTVSSVTLLFARNVIRQSNVSIIEAKSMPNFLLAGSGIIVSIVSIFWTWASRRLSRRLLKKTTSRLQAANMLRKAIKLGVTINLVGMLCTIIGAEQIVGALAIKVLTTSRTISLVESSTMLQPLDILVVQANTNTLFSHFCSIVALLYMSRSLAKLDPPSIEDDKKKR